MTQVLYIELKLMHKGLGMLSLKNTAVTDNEQVSKQMMDMLFYPSVGLSCWKVNILHKKRNIILKPKLI